MGIRYGLVSQESHSVEWIFVSHTECDGIGGFARLLRERGMEPEKLPETKIPCRDVFGPLWNLIRTRTPKSECANRTDWSISDKTNSQKTTAPKSAAWYVFSEQKTKTILQHCRDHKVTVNSFLLHHLDKAIRPEIRQPHLKIPWMIPVNMRGDINYPDDTENHVSCVEATIAHDDSPQTIHQQILQSLQRGEHRAIHILLRCGKFLSHSTKVKFLNKDRSKPTGNIGSFSNLGVWDSDEKFPTKDTWLFCPPVVTGQLLAAGCVTFQNQLSITMQANPNHPSPDIAQEWMARWVDGIVTVP